jgi:hypothetical protein
MVGFIWINSDLKAGFKYLTQANRIMKVLVRMDQDCNSALAEGQLLSLEIVQRFFLKMEDL